jgi:hypothetical protein
MECPVFSVIGSSIRLFFSISISVTGDPPYVSNVTKDVLSGLQPARTPIKDMVSSEKDFVFLLSI